MRKIKFLYSSGIFLSGIGLSLGFQLGVLNVGLNEIIFFITAVCFYLRSDLLGYYLIFFRDNGGLTLILASFFVFCAIGIFTGAFLDASPKAIFQLIRIFIFIFIVVPLPWVSYRAGLSSPLCDLKVFMLGVMASVFVNWAEFFVGDSASLPGQNGIGNAVALTFPFLIFCFQKTVSNKNKFLFLMMIMLFLLTSLYSWSKGSWIGILLGAMMISLNRRSLLKFLLGGGILVGLTLLFFYEEVSYIYSVELSSSAGSKSNSQRLAAIVSGFLIALDYPFGIGSAYEVVVENYVGLSKLHWIMPDPHNTVAHVVSYGGIPALIMYMAIHLTAAKRIYYGRELDPDIKVTALAIFFVGVFSMQLSGEYFTQAFWWFLMGLFFSFRSQTKYDN